MTKSLSKLKEKWKPVDGFSGYEVSNIGRIRSLDRFICRKTGGTRFYKGQIIKLAYMKKGYAYFRPSIGRKVYKSVMISRAVAFAFVKNPDPRNKLYVNHKDGKVANNFYGNLEWVTASENGIHAYRVLKIKHPRGMLGKSRPRSAIFQYSLDGRLIKRWKSMMEIEKKLGYSHGNIGQACNKIYRQCYGFIWRRENSKGLIRKYKIAQKTLSGELVKIWKSFKEINQNTGYNRIVLSNCCRGKVSNCYGFKWRFVRKKNV